MSLLFGILLILASTLSVGVFTMGTSHFVDLLSRLIGQIRSRKCK